MSPSFAHPLPPRADFDPLAVLEIAPSGEVRSVAWLCDPATDREAVQEYLRDHSRDTEGNEPSDQDLALQPRTSAEVEAGFVEQELRVRFSECALVVSPGTGASDVSPFTAPVAIIGSALPADQPAGASSVEDLRDYLTGRGFECLRATAVAADRSWLDESVIVAYSDPGELHSAAFAHFQAYVLVWDPVGIMRLVDVVGELDGRVVAEFPVNLRRVVARPCPLLRDAQPGELCKMHGGPWVSASILAAARWERRRARMIRALGCDTCEDGAATVLGGQVLAGRRRRGILIAPLGPVPNRYQRAISVGVSQG